MAGKPGRSGRKRQGQELKVYFNSRIDPALRDRLQAEADKNGRTLSREIERRLKGSFKRTDPLEDERRMFLFLFEEAERLTTIGDKNWRNDENLYFAFWTAVEELLRLAFVPTRPWRPIREWRGTFEHPLFKRPEDFGRAAVFQITNSLASAESLDAVADLSPGDPRREYANAAQFMRRAKGWAQRYQRDAAFRAKIESDPEYQILMREQDEMIEEMSKQRLSDTTDPRLADWIKRVDAVTAKYKDWDKS